MIYKNIFMNFVFDAPLSPQASRGSRQSAKKYSARAYLAAKRVARH
jgi:hypothetical protein